MPKKIKTYQQTQTERAKPQKMKDDSMSHDIVRDAREDREDAQRWRNRSDTTIPGPNRNQVLAALATLDQYPLLKGRVTEFQVEAALRSALSPGQLVGGDPCPTCGVQLSTLIF